jgi:hypothetical protein
VDINAVTTSPPKGSGFFQKDSMAVTVTMTLSITLIIIVIVGFMAIWRRIGSVLNHNPKSL